MIDGSGKRRTVDRERHVLGSEADETRQEPRKKSCRPRRRCTVAVRPGSQSLRPHEGDFGRPGRGASSRLAAGAARQRDGVSVAARGGDTCARRVPRSARTANVSTSIPNSSRKNSRPCRPDLPCTADRATGISNSGATLRSGAPWGLPRTFRIASAAGSPAISRTTRI